jgi:hypothetical protein
VNKSGLAHDPHLAAMAAPRASPECSTAFHGRRSAKATKARGDAASKTLKAGVRRNDPDIPANIKARSSSVRPDKRGDLDGMLSLNQVDD